jgi:hypothetical protein
MVAMRIFPFKEKSPWQNLESNPGPHDQWSETLTTRPRAGWSLRICNTYCFPQQQWLHQRVPLLRYTYIAWLAIEE